MGNTIKYVWVVEKKNGYRQWIPTGSISLSRAEGRRQLSLAKGMWNEYPWYRLTKYVPVPKNVCLVVLNAK
jgi:hypothetical protein